MEFAEYRQVPANVQQQLMAEVTRQHR